MVYCLLIEGDDARIQEAKNRIESFVDVKVMVAKTIEEGIRLIESSDTPNYDLVMLDFDNIDMQEIRKIRAKTDAAIIGFNNSEDESTGYQSLKFGADDFLPTKKHTDKAIYESIISSINRKNIRNVSKRIQSKLMLLTGVAGG